MITINPEPIEQNPPLGTVINPPQIAIEKIVLESGDGKYIYLLGDECIEIDGKPLPINTAFIVQDEMMQLHRRFINVKVIFERKGVQEFTLTFEVSSKAKMWDNVSAMNMYYEIATIMLSQTYSGESGYIMRTNYKDVNSFLIQYSFMLCKIGNVQMIEMIEQDIDSMHDFSEEVNYLCLTDEM